ncbi:hypothetical protein GCM10023317_71380 [Actinopolymorpha pittospori]
MPSRASAERAAAVAEGGVAAAEEGVAAQPDNPTTAHISATAAGHLPFLINNDRLSPSQRACLTVATETDESGKDAGGRSCAAPMPLELSATGEPDVALVS